MDTDSLKAFIAVADAHSFSLAAEKLHLTQPAVSKRIAALEHKLQHAVFDRLGREVLLTEAGAHLLPRAQSILRSIEDAERSIKELSGEVSGTLRVATSHHIGLHYMPPVLRKFVTNHPQVQMQFEFLDSEQAHERVSRGDCELAVVTLAPRLESPLVGEPLWPDPLSFVVSPRHVLSEESKMELDVLSRYPAILPDLNTYTGRLVNKCFVDAGLKLQLNMATNYLETIKVMVAAGLGWSVLPKTMIDENLSGLAVREVVLERQLGVVTHAKRTLSNAATAFYTVLKNSQ